MLAVDGEWVGGGVKEAGRPQGAVPAFLRTDVGCPQHSRGEVDRLKEYLGCGFPIPGG